jgi:hypothetical protein
MHTNKRGAIPLPAQALLCSLRTLHGQHFLTLGPLGPLVIPGLWALWPLSNQYPRSSLFLPGAPSATQIKQASQACRMEDLAQPRGLAQFKLSFLVSGNKQLAYWVGKLTWGSHQAPLSRLCATYVVLQTCKGSTPFLNLLEVLTWTLIKACTVRPWDPACPQGCLRLRHVSKQDDMGNQY